MNCSSPDVPIVLNMQCVHTLLALLQAKDPPSFYWQACDAHDAGRAFCPLDAPPEEPGQERRPKADLKMQTRGSRFVRFQEMKLQERAIEVCRMSLLGFQTPLSSVHMHVLPEGLGKRHLQAPEGCTQERSHSLLLRPASCDTAGMCCDRCPREPRHAAWSCT